MKKVRQVSNISGVSVRTLHYYDSIGLLSPSERTEKGYRLYDDSAIEKLQLILLFRELEFSLSEIKKILYSDNFDIYTALSQQVKLLKLKREHFDKLILFAEQIINKEDKYMDFTAFDKTEIKNCEKEVMDKWGNTEEYKEYSTKNKNKNDFDNGLMQIFTEFGKVKDLSPDSNTAFKLVNKLKQYITDNYYACKKEVLFRLGQMYVADERFKNNIDKAGGNGTSEFVCKAIENYCK